MDSIRYIISLPGSLMEYCTTYFRNRQKQYEQQEQQIEREKQIQNSGRGLVPEIDAPSAPQRTSRG